MTQKNAIESPGRNHKITQNFKPLNLASAFPSSLSLVNLFLFLFFQSMALQDFGVLVRFSVFLSPICAQLLCY